MKARCSFWTHVLLPVNLGCYKPHPSSVYPRLIPTIERLWSLLWFLHRPFCRTVTVVPYAASYTAAPPPSVHFWVVGEMQLYFRTSASDPASCSVCSTFCNSHTQQRALARKNCVTQAGITPLVSSNGDGFVYILAVCSFNSSPPFCP